MKLAFCLFEYFPFGGMQRDCLRIAQACAREGAEVDILTREWQGEKPKDVCVQILETKAISNAKKVSKYVAKALKKIKQEKYDGVVGFSKMPGLDVYYAADPCYLARVNPKYGWLYKLTDNYRTYNKFEQAVFAKDSKTEILLINPKQQNIYQAHYQTDDQRFYTLPPGILRDRCAPPDYLLRRAEIRDQLALSEEDKLLLFVGSGFKTKGLDRALTALSELPEQQLEHTQFWIVGEDNPKPYQKQIRKLNLQDKVYFLGGRNDVAELMLGADALVHPAYSENTGTVLLEAVVAGLPVVTTQVCGYADYIKEAQGGIVIPEPFEQQRLAQALEVVLDHAQPWRSNGIDFGARADIYSLVEQAQKKIFETVQRKVC
jgi:UDP-glucose:(heptosyl)LPS alpha-1,3-glucosyltransferase